jgi:glycine cleavage system aminomethyltransferase T
VARSPLHAWHAAHGARFRASDGWQIPAAYTGTEGEVEAARSGLGLADISPCAKMSVIGSGLAAVLTALGAARSGQQPGEIALVQAGGPSLACRLTADHLLLLASFTGTDWDTRLAGLPNGDTLVRREVTTAYAGFCLIGPQLEDLLPRITILEPAALAEGRCAETGLAGVPALLIRPPRDELPVLQVFVSWDVAEYVWEWLLEGHKVTLVGWEGLERLRRSGPE